jgi:hypothetical protein
MTSGVTSIDRIDALWPEIARRDPGGVRANIVNQALGRVREDLAFLELTVEDYRPLAGAYTQRVRERVAAMKSEAPRAA